MVTTGKISKKRSRSRSQKFKKAVLGNPQGVIQARVQQVGPERFGIVAVDCAKARSKWMLTDFYGNVLTQPADVEHNRSGFQLAILMLKQAVEKHQLKDIIVAVEMTGTFHKPPMRAFRKAGFETRLVHPFASSYYRLPEHGDIKTDDNELDAIFRATVNGFGLIEKPIDPIHQQLQILSRHRRDLVKKKSKLQCQIRHHLEQGLPGFAALFEDDALWTQVTPIPLLREIAQRGGTVDVVKQARVKGLTQWLREAKVRPHQKTLERVIVWASRYQSDEVDRGGKLTRFRNARLRAAWMMVADNMCKCNVYWMTKAAKWRAEGHKPQDIRCRVANRLTRTVFQMVSGRQLFRHTSRLDRGYVIDKLLTFLREHQTSPAVIVRDLKHAIDQLPKAGQLEEAAKLQEAALKARRSRQKAPQELGTLLVAVLARLGVAAKQDDVIEST